MVYPTGWVDLTDLDAFGYQIVAFDDFGGRK
jgi:hypothetical protein